MTVDCRWVVENLEGLFCEKLSDEDCRRIRTHIEGCASCRKESEALHAIDPLIKNYFQRQLQVAHRPPVVHKGRVFGLTTAAVTAVIALFLFLRTPHVTPSVQPGPTTETTASVSPAPTQAPIKIDQPAEIERAKPTPESSPAPDRKPGNTPVVTSDSPEFLITDPAGYSHNLSEYRGHIVVIGVWDRGQLETIANLERLYKAHSSDVKFRLLGVSNQRQAKPANTTFPVFYNQGSKLLGLQSGEFALIDSAGAIQMRGSLVKDFDRLTKAIQ